MDILHFLKSHHDAITAACSQLETTTCINQRRLEFAALTQRLEAYMTLEQDYLYPEIAGLFPGADNLVAIGAANAAIIDRHLKSLAKLWSKSGEEQPDFAPHLAELHAVLVKHFEQEEQILMPKMRTLMRTEDREDLGQVFADAEADGLAALLFKAKDKVKTAAVGSRKRA